ADDLRRWLDDEPIAARRLSPAERAIRWVRKNPAAAGAGLLTVVAATFGIVAFALGVFYFRAEEAREGADSARIAEAREREKAEQAELQTARERDAAEAARAAEADQRAKAEAARADATKWRIINIALPLVLVALFGLAFNWLRRRRYAR
ncbi:MAG: hypothetical protein AAGA31_18220, partial [Bacteroidota bacterium]